MKPILKVKKLSGSDVIKLLIELTAIEHPVVRIPKKKTFVALLKANPPKEFLRRLEAFNPSNN
jgi:hypothetical protein